MIFAFVRSLIGNFGRALMDFYIENSLVINGIILLYALLIYMGHRNYLSVIEQIISNLKKSNTKYSNTPVKKVSNSEYKNIDWFAIQKQIRFPVISEPKKWKLRICTIEYLMSEFTQERINSSLATIISDKEE